MEVETTHRSIIFSGGTFNGNELPIEFRRDDLIICADSGCDNLLKLGIKPHVLVGDLDSISPESLEFITDQGIKIIEHPVEKDKTDTHLALELAITAGVKEIIILGALGGRIDHMWANIGLLWLAHKKKVNAKIIDEENEIFIISEHTIITGEEGEIFSLFPIGKVARGVNIKGAKYPLTQWTLRYGETICASNEFLSSLVEIDIKEGAVIFIKNRNK